MIKKDDVMELHDTIYMIEQRQKMAIKAINDAMIFIENSGELLDVLKKQYKELKEKATN